MIATNIIEKDSFPISTKIFIDDTLNAFDRVVYLTLYVLKDSDGVVTCKISDLAEQSGIARTTLYTYLDDLISKGYITMQTNPKISAVYDITLTIYDEGDIFYVFTQDILSSTYSIYQKIILTVFRNKKTMTIEDLCTFTNSSYDTVKRHLQKLIATNNTLLFKYNSTLKTYTLVSQEEVVSNKHDDISQNSNPIEHMEKNPSFALETLLQNINLSDSEDTDITEKTSTEANEPSVQYTDKQGVDIKVTTEDIVNPTYVYIPKNKKFMKQSKLSIAIYGYIAACNLQNKTITLQDIQSHFNKSWKKIQKALVELLKNQYLCYDGLKVNTPKKKYLIVDAQMFNDQNASPKKIFNSLNVDSMK